jgi:hydrogenase nickel incorporation protein HypB
VGRFHRHDDGSWHDHDVDEDGPPAAHSHDAGDHSQYQTGRERVQLLERVFGENDRKAAENRRDLEHDGVIAINLMSAPGAGKTTLLRETLRQLAGRLRVAVIEGDIETSLDADRLRNLGASIELINTGDGFGGECHLDAPMVRSALVRLPLPSLDLILIENVGNLVCPAEFDVGEHARAMIHAVTEGEDKPLKYPVMFRSADLILINKIDLLPHLDVDLGAFRRNLQAVNPTATTIEISARTGAGVAAWCDWIESFRRPVQESATPFAP